VSLRTRALPLAAACIGIGACAPATPPGDSFATLEARLLAADTVRIAFDVTADGSVTAALSGEVAIDGDAGVTLTATGVFDGEPAALRLRADRERYTYGNAAELTMNRRPDGLVEALVIGLTRMGILHNLAMLTSGARPDHVDGGVRDWVSVGGFRRDADAIGFDLTVAGEPAGTATLVLDANGLPVERRQAVPFPEGEMRVVETYRSVSVIP